MAKFKTMEEAIAWVKEHRIAIDEQDCPKFDMPNPIEKDVKECKIICSNHWGCHTFRHLRGTRDSKKHQPFIFR
jgi:hypothetical protein